MRTNIEIDDALMEQALQAGPFKTKKDAVEAGLRLLARQAAYKEILKWRGQLPWEGDESVDWAAAPALTSQPASSAAVASPSSALIAQEPSPAPRRKRHVGR